MHITCITYLIKTIIVLNNMVSSTRLRFFISAHVLPLLLLISVHYKDVIPKYEFFNKPMLQMY